MNQNKNWKKKLWIFQRYLHQKQFLHFVVEYEIQYLNHNQDQELFYLHYKEQQNDVTAIKRTAVGETNKKERE